jgi:hypothetical protein
MKKFLILLLPLLLSACVEESAEKKQARATSATLEEAQAQLGMPAIINFREKRILKDIYEMRDQEIATHSYIVNPIKGCLMYLGQSIGYGVPYATQYSNPQVLKRVSDPITLPQAEPNGLYMPESAQATWVMLLDPKTNKVSPAYVEPELFVSTSRMSGMECK